VAGFMLVSVATVGDGQTALFLALLMCGGLGLGGCFMIPEAMKPDIIDYDEFLSGTRREGRYVGMWQCVARAGGATGLMIGLEALKISGYVANQVGPQTPASLFVIKFFYGGVFSICGILVVIVVYLYPIDRQVHQEIILATRCRKSGGWASDPVYGGPPCPPYIVSGNNI